MGDHKYFIVTIIFYISKNNNYKLLCKLDLTVTYCFGCSTCNSWPFFFKIVANKAYLQGLHRSGSNRTKPVQTGSVSSAFFGFFFMEWSNCNWKSGFFCSCPVSVWFFSGSMYWTFNPYMGCATLARLGLVLFFFTVSYCSILWSEETKKKMP